MIVEIFTIDKFDKESKNITDAFKNYGGKCDIKFTKLYKIIADKDISYFKKIAEEVLVDKIVENYGIYDDLGKTMLNFPFVIDIWFKESVTDICGESVKLAIRDAGYMEPVSVRTAKRFYFSNKDSKALSFVMEDYANELIHRVDFKKFLGRVYK